MYNQFTALDQKPLPMGKILLNPMQLPKANNTVMVHIRHLREKIGDDAQKPRFIKNVWGVGYIIE